MVSPAGWGKILFNGSESPAGCNYPGGAKVTLQAIPFTGYRFERWSGNVASTTSATTTITMSQSETVTAHFVLLAQGKTLSQARELLNSGKDILVLDVSSITDFNNSHMLCAKNYPFNTASKTFDVSIANLTPYKDTEILIYDQIGTRSKPAGDYLAAQGFKFIYYMTDDLNDWIAEGYATYMTAEDGPICTALAPLAYAGPDKSVNENASVTLNGQGPGGAAYSWTQTKGANVALSSPNAAQPTFTAPDLKNGNDELEFLLTVTSGSLKDSDTVTVYVTWINQAPTANAGPDQTVKPGVKVTLDGSKSSDPEDASSLTYAWSVSAASGVKSPALSGSSSVNPTFTAPSGSGWIKYRLTVTDNGGITDDDEVLISVSGSNDSGVPEAPTGLAANAVSYKKIMLKWTDKSDNEDGFKIERKKGGCNSSYEYIQVATVQGSSKYEDVAVEPATQYAYRVRAYKGSKYSAYTSNCSTATTGASGTPNAPTKLVAAYVDASKIDLTWDEGSADVKNFKIYRQVNNTGAWTLIASPGPGIHSYRDTHANNNQTTAFYRYKIQACNDAGCSPPTYSVGAPFTPTNFKASVDSKGKVVLEWTDTSNDNSGFELWRKDGSCSASTSWAQF